MSNPIAIQVEPQLPPEDGFSFVAPPTIVPDEDDNDDDDDDNDEEEYEYDYGNDGESCRLDLIDKWLARYNDNEADGGAGFTDSRFVTPRQEEGTTTTTSRATPREQQQSQSQQQRLTIESLRAMQETTLYKTILSDCSYFLDQFNAAAEATCVQEQQTQPQTQTQNSWSEDNNNNNNNFGFVYYSELWRIGPINMDGGFLLAADLILSNQLRDSRPLIPCSDSCYVRYPRSRSELDDDSSSSSSSSSSSDCQEGSVATGSAFLDVERITSISRESEGMGENNNNNNNLEIDIKLEPYQKMLCDGWLSADAAYQNLRLCASESNLARTMISEKDKNRQDDTSQDSSSYSNAASNYNRNRNRNHNYNYNYNDSETINTADGVAKAFAQQRQKQATCSALALEGACPALDNSKSSEGIMAGPSSSGGLYDGIVEDGDSWTESGAVVVAAPTAIATATAAAAALVNGFTVVALLFQMFD